MIRSVQADGIHYYDTETKVDYTWRGYYLVGTDGSWFDYSVPGQIVSSKGVRYLYDEKGIVGDDGSMHRYSKEETEEIREAIRKNALNKK